MRTGLKSLLCCGVALVTGAFAPVWAQDAAYVSVPAGAFTSVLSNSSDNKPIAVKAFSVRVMPVTNAQFLAFVNANQNWSRDRVAVIFADRNYLHSWPSADAFGAPDDAQRPVTSVSWFAAQAFCASEGGRLPSWYEWEYLAAADATRADARKDPVWRAKILSWYDQPTNLHGPTTGGAANYYGVRDLHGLIWEWVDDFNALFISPDSRNQGDPDKLKFCGAGALSLQDKENFAILMRIALLSSLSAADSTDNLGFRCVRNPLTGP